MLMCRTRSVPSCRAMLAMVASLGCFVAIAAAPAAAETVRIEGSAGFAEMMGPYRTQIEEETGKALALTGNTSPDGLVAVLKGKADLAMIWAPLDAVVALVRKTNPDLPFARLREFPVSKAFVAYPVNPDNPVRFIPVAKLKAILTGQLDNWHPLGGPDLPIHVVLLRSGGAAKRATEELMLAGEHMTPRSEIVVERERDLIDTVAHDRGAIGICRASLVVNRLPRARTSVPVQQSFSFVTLGEPSDAMRDVIVATRSILFGEVR